MTRDQKQEVIEALKEKFSQYTNFYITDTESLSVAGFGPMVIVSSIVDVLHDGT